MSPKFFIKIDRMSFLSIFPLLNIDWHPAKEQYDIRI